MAENHFDHAQWGVIDDIMQQGLRSTFPAAVLLIQQRDQTIFHRAYGWIDPQFRQHPVQESTLFDLASLTKLFTSTAFMTLVARGVVSLDEPITDVFPELHGAYPILSGIDPHTKQLLPREPMWDGKMINIELVTLQLLPPYPMWDGKIINAELVTFRHLLTHTSGLAAWVDLCQDQVSHGYLLPHHVTEAERRSRLETILSAPRFVYPPGKGLQYSDIGFMLLGEAVERLSHTSLPDYLAREVFIPLGMSSATYNPTAHGVPRESIAPTEYCSWRGRRVWGEVHDENAACLGGVAGHAGLFANATDVAALGRCYLHGGEPILPPELVAEMVREQVWVGNERRGLGWKLQTPDASPVGTGFSLHSFGHTGFTGTSLWVDPDRTLVVALLTNRVYYGRDASVIANFRIRLHEKVIAAVDTLTEHII